MVIFINYSVALIAKGLDFYITVLSSICATNWWGSDPTRICNRKSIRKALSSICRIFSASLELKQLKTAC